MAPAIADRGYAAGFRRHLRSPTDDHRREAAAALLSAALLSAALSAGSSACRRCFHARDSVTTRVIASNGVVLSRQYSRDLYATRSESDDRLAAAPSFGARRCAEQSYGVSAERLARRAMSRTLRPRLLLSCTSSCGRRSSAPCFELVHVAMLPPWSRARTSSSCGATAQNGPTRCGRGRYHARHEPRPAWSRASESRFRRQFGVTLIRRHWLRRCGSSSAMPTSCCSTCETAIGDGSCAVAEVRAEAKKLLRVSQPSVGAPALRSIGDSAAVVVGNVEEQSRARRRLSRGIRLYGRDTHAPRHPRHGRPTRSRRPVPHAGQREVADPASTRTKRRLTREISWAVSRHVARAVEHTAPDTSR